MQPAITRLVASTNALSTQANTMTPKELRQLATNHPALADALNEVLAAVEHMNRTRRPRGLRKVVNCEYCGKEFVRLGSPTQASCSHTCAQKRRYALGQSLPKNAPRAKFVELQCAHCRGTFQVTEAAARTRRYCSRSCSARAPRKN